MVQGISFVQPKNKSDNNAPTDRMADPQKWESNGMNRSSLGAKRTFGQEYPGKEECQETDSAGVNDNKGGGQARTGWDRMDGEDDEPIASTKSEEESTN